MELDRVLSALGPQGPYYLWVLGGVLALALWIVLGYYVVRRLSGHRRFRGTWYSSAQFEILLEQMAEDQRSGSRVMRQDEIALLRKYRGRGPGVGFDSRNSYF